jgi:cell wall-associated NlpC family hydrolase
MRLHSGLITVVARARLALWAAFVALSLSVMLPSAADAADKPKRGKRATASAQQRRAGTARAKAAARPSRRGRAARRSARASSRTSGRRGRRGRAVVMAPVIPAVDKAFVVSDSASVLRDSIVSLARQQIGTPYILGAQTPGRAFDCSGLVKYVMGWLNVQLPRTANEQAYTGLRVGRELDRMKPGDLLTFGNGRRITHIAIYSGNGRYVHASRPGVGVVESVLNARASRFKGAIRLVADASDTVTATP